MIIATRDLEYVAEDGTVIPVPVCIYLPCQEAQHWRCPTTIGFPNGVKESAGLGFDAVQALVLAINDIGNNLYFSDYHKTGRLKWGEPDKGYGFPVTKNARDLLIGDDKRFDGE